jgi:glycosyltransferase involved in cell wall biosynthesis
MQQMQQRFPRAAHKMHTITNGFDNVPVPPLRQAHEHKCLFRYVGVLNERRQPDVLLQALRLAIQAEPRLADEVHLELIGEIGEHADKPRRYGVEKQVSSLGRVEWLKSLSYMRGSDVNVLLQTIDEGADVISGKAFEYLAAAKPILAVVSPTGGDAWLIEQTRSGKCVAWTDPAGVAVAIREYHALWQKKALGQGAPADISRFSRRALTAELAAIFDSVLGRSSA